MLYPVLCGTVCIVCKLYFHLTTLKTARNFFSDYGMCLWLSFSISWNEHQSIRSLWNQWKHQHPIQWNGCRYSILLKHTFCSKHTMWLYYRRHILDKKYWKKQFQNKLSLLHINVKNLPKYHDELELYIHWISNFQSGLWLKIGWTNQHKTYLT